MAPWYKNILEYSWLSQFDEQKDQVAVEQILRVVFLDAERPSPVSDFRIILSCRRRTVILVGSCSLFFIAYNDNKLLKEI